MSDGYAEGGVYRILRGQFSVGQGAEPGLDYAEVPLLYGDGVHDDAPALNAGISGKPIRCAWCLELVNLRDLSLLGEPVQCPSKHLDRTGGPILCQEIYRRGDTPLTRRAAPCVSHDSC